MKFFEEQAPEFFVTPPERGVKAFLSLSMLPHENATFEETVSDWENKILRSRPGQYIQNRYIGIETDFGEVRLLAYSSQTQRIRF